MSTISGNTNVPLSATQRELAGRIAFMNDRSTAFTPYFVGLWFDAACLGILCVLFVMWWYTARATEKRWIRMIVVSERACARGGVVVTTRRELDRAHGQAPLLQALQPGCCRTRTSDAHAQYFVVPVQFGCSAVLHAQVLEFFAADFGEYKQFLDPKYMRSTVLLFGTSRAAATVRASYVLGTRALTLQTFYAHRAWVLSGKQIWIPVLVTPMLCV
jgi:hypothetical protein